MCPAYVYLSVLTVYLSRKKEIFIVSWTYFVFPSLKYFRVYLSYSSIFKLSSQEKKRRLASVSSWVSRINSLTLPTELLWPIHGHGHKYLYQLSPTCEQKPIGEKEHIRSSNLRRCSTKSTPFTGKMCAFLVTPCQKTFLKTPEPTSTKTILSREEAVEEKCLMNKVNRIEWLCKCDRTALLPDGMTTSSVRKKDLSHAVKVRAEKKWKAPLLAPRVSSNTSLLHG